MEAGPEGDLGVSADAAVTVATSPLNQVALLRDCLLSVAAQSHRYVREPDGGVCEARNNVLESLGYVFDRETKLKVNLGTDHVLRKATVEHIEEGFWVEPLARCLKPGGVLREKVAWPQSLPSVAGMAAEAGAREENSVAEWTN